MKTFIFRLIQFSLIGLIPLIIAGVIYITMDPFKVIYNYDSFYDADVKGTLVLNQDYVSTSTFINNRKTTNYNSFIFGSSRSIVYQVSDWKKYIGQNALCYHFDALGESLWALNKKIEYIDNVGNMIDNILLILDFSTLIREKPIAGHLFIISPPLVGNSNIIDFHKTFFLAFLTPKFFYAFLDYKISGQLKPYMKQNRLFDDRPRNYDVLTNEIRFDYFENLIRQNKYYTQERLSVFYNRDTSIQKMSPECIFEKQKSMLNNILSITKKHNTAIKIVISPLYDQLKLNEKDVDYLKLLFGDDNVFDFSGINEITNDYKNYYENSHYRPHVANEIMDVVYDRRGGGA